MADLIALIGAIIVLLRILYLGGHLASPVMLLTVTALVLGLPIVVVGSLPGRLAILTLVALFGWVGRWPYVATSSLVLLSAAAIRLHHLNLAGGRWGSVRTDLWTPMFGYLLLAIWFAWRYRAGTDTPVPIHDNLDGNLPRYLMMAKVPIFAPMDAVVPQALGGIPKNSLHSDLTLYAVLFRLFPPFTAYVFHEFFYRSVAFLGMLCLCRDHGSRSAEIWIPTGVALAFSLVPFWPGGSLNVAGQPLLWWAAFHLMKRDIRLRYWLVVGLFPFASSLAMVGWATVLGLGFVFLGSSLTSRRLHIPLLLASILMGSIYVAVEYRAFYQLFFDSDYVSHRAEFGMRWFSIRSVNSWDSFLHYTFGQFVLGNYYVRTYHWPVIMLSGIAVPIAASFLFIIRRFLPGLISEPAFSWDPSMPTDRRIGGTMALIAAGLIFCALADGLGSLDAFKAWTLEGGGALNTLNIRRFNRFAGVGWYFLLFLALLYFRGFVPAGREWAAVLLIAQLVHSVHATSEADVLLQFHRSDDVSYKAYYSTPLFDEIREYIGRPQKDYRVASVGIFPGVSQYNGFYTADGYFPNYPLEYKHRFRRLIAKEIEKSKELIARFDDWGGHCFAIPGDAPKLPMTMKKDLAMQSIDLELNHEALHDLGIDYVFARLEIERPEVSGLEFVEFFEHEDAIWKVHLYRVLPLAEAVESIEGNLIPNRKDGKA